MIERRYNINMPLNNKYRDIAIDLLCKYVDNQQSLIWEYSFNFDDSYDRLEKEINKYLRKLNATEEEKEKILQQIRR